MSISLFIAKGCGVSMLTAALLQSVTDKLRGIIGRFPVFHYSMQSWTFPSCVQSPPGLEGCTTLHLCPVIWRSSLYANPVQILSASPELCGLDASLRFSENWQRSQWKTAPTSSRQAGRQAQRQEGRSAGCCAPQPSSGVVM